MSDYRHDIYGPKGLSQLSGLYTVKQSAFKPSVSYETATLTVIHQGSGTAIYGCPNIVSDGDNEYISPWIIIDSVAETKTYSLILNDGVAEITTDIKPHLWISNLTGDITKSGSNYIVTGDCGFNA